MRIVLIATFGILIRLFSQINLVKSIEPDHLACIQWSELNVCCNMTILSEI